MNAARCLLLVALLPSLAAAQDKPKPPLRWGVDPTGAAPYVYQDNAGNYTGFEWELAGYLADKLGRAPVMRAGDWDKLPQLLDRPADAAGGIDIVLAGYELRDDLAKQYAATRPYYVYRLQVMAHRDDDTIRGWGDLPARDGKPGKSVGVLGGSVAHDYAKSLFGDRVVLQINPDVSTVIGLVKDRRMDATIQDGPAVSYFLKEVPELKSVGEARKPGFYVIYLRKSDVELRRQLDEAITAGMKDGSLKHIYQKYGLWNADQEWLAYTQIGEWPAADGEAVATGVVADKDNPWPRMIRELIGAAGMTVFLSVTSFPLAMLLGLLVAVGRVYGPRWLGVPLGVYVEVLRGTPLLLQLYTGYYLLPKLLPGMVLSPLEAGILGLAVNYSAYEAENYRAGLRAIPRGQLEAALALGMTRWTAIRRVVVPQAVRLVIPPVTNDFIALFKDTSVCSVILITELTRKYNELYNFNRDYIVELAFVTAGLYLLMSYPLALVARYLERRLAEVTTMIRVSNLTKSFGPARILDGVSLDVQQGEVTALVGPSGGGKSTLLRCINGLEDFQAGEVCVGDVSLVGGRPHPQADLLKLRRRVGMVFQQFHLFPHMTALENVLSGPRLALGRTRDQATPLAKQLLDRVGLGHKFDARPASLSGGQQQRVAIARALAVGPAAILFDEPTSALDPQMANEVLAVMRDLARDGQTMVVVTHDRDFARQATTVHRMEAGRVVRSGPPADVLA